MIKKTIRYKDFNDVTRTDDFYFNLTKAELVALESDVPGGFAALLQGIMKAEDGLGVYRQIEYIIGRAYGIKSEDGRRFRKTAQDLEDFMTTEAYSNLLDDLMNNSKHMQEFVEGLMPRSLMTETNKIMEQFDDPEEAVEYLRQQSLENSGADVVEIIEK